MRGCFVLLAVAVTAIALSGTVVSSHTGGAVGYHPESDRYMAPRSLHMIRSVSTALGWDEYSTSQAAKPTYLKLSEAPFILAEIASADTLDETCWETEFTRHNMASVSGRAANLLEKMFGIEVPLIVRGAGDHDRLLAQLEARQQLQFYRRGVTDRVKEHGTGTDVETLQARYQAAIAQGKGESDGTASFYFEGLKAFEEMMCEFFPLGRRLADLETIVGGEAVLYENPNILARNAAATTTGVVCIRFSDHARMHALAYLLQVDEGTIRSVAVR